VLNQPQPAPTLGFRIGDGDRAQRPSAVVAHRQMQQLAAQLQA
jgi:hypothetical protein